MTEPKLRVLSLGAGVQSTTLLLMSAEGLLPHLDAAVFSDTGWEPRRVYSHLMRLEEVAAAAGIPVYVVNNGSIRTERGAAQMPLYLTTPDGKKAGMSKRQCTTDYKMVPIRRQVRELLGIKAVGRPPAGLWAEQWIGFSYDEIFRIKDDPVAFSRSVYPLIDLKMTRDDCYDWLNERGWADTPKSACVGCPYHTDDYWKWMKKWRPEEFEDAAAFDQSLRVGTGVAGMSNVSFIHKSRTPLKDVDFGDMSAVPERQPDTPGCGPYSCMGDQLAKLLGNDAEPFQLEPAA